MRPTYGDICCGGGGAALGAVAAGFEHAWGIEKHGPTAEVARANLGGHVLEADVLAVDPRRLEPVDALHASPPCPNFSSAKVGGVETTKDVALARKVAEFIAVLEPRVFTLENVPMYRHSMSWRLIEAELFRCGYWVHLTILNAANLGVPQTRRRMIVRAVRHGLVPELPAVEPWRGWYDAIEDLIPDLPESQLASWQLKRLPSFVATMLVSGGGSHYNAEEKRVATFRADQPAMTVLPGTGGRARGFLVHPTDMRTMPVRLGTEPALTVVGSNTGMSRAFLVDGANASHATGEPTVRRLAEPAFTITAGGNRVNHRALLERGRIVKMTPRALARFQTFPDSYRLPDKLDLACRVVGNAVPPLLARRIYEGLREVTA